MRLDPVAKDGRKRFFAGDGFRQAPYSNWNRINRKVYFNSNSADNVNSGYAAPSLV